VITRSDVEVRIDCFSDVVEQLNQAEDRTTALSGLLRARTARLENLKQANATIAERDERIAVLEANLGELDAWNQRSYEKHRSQQAKIADLETAISARDAHIAEIEARIAILNTEIALRTAEIEAWGEGFEQVSDAELETVAVMPTAKGNADDPSLSGDTAIGLAPPPSAVSGESAWSDLEPITGSGERPSDASVRPTLTGGHVGFRAVDLTGQLPGRDYRSDGPETIWDDDLGPMPRERMDTIGFDQDPTLIASTSLGLPAPQHGELPIVTDADGNAVPDVWSVDEWPSYRIDAPMSGGEGGPNIDGLVRMDPHSEAREDSERTTLLGPPPMEPLPPVKPAPLRPFGEVPLRVPRPKK